MLTLDVADLPALTTRQNFRFFRDVDRFLVEGRRLGPIWRCRIGLRSIVVFSTTEPLSDERAVFFNPEPLIAWLGRAPLWARGAEHDALLHRARAMLERAIAGLPELRTALRRALTQEADMLDRHARRGVPARVELVGVLRRVVLRWAVPFFATASHSTPAASDAELAERWLAAADTLALFIPALRFTAPWRGLAKARAALVDRLGHGPITADLALTMIAGLDAPLLLAAETIAAGPTADVGEVLRQRPPVPFVLRETEGRFVVRQGPQSVRLAHGQGFAVDTQRARAPFGFGAHACVGGALGRALAVLAHEETTRAGLVACGGKRGRLRLGYGYRSLDAELDPVALPLVGRPA